VSLEVVAIALTLVVHLLGAIVLVWAIIGDEHVDWRGTLWPRDDDGGGGGPGFAPPTGPDGGGDGGGIPLPDAEPSPIRLREPGRIGQTYPRPQRRPAHAPERTPAREPVGS
jgi:hypothetical protein